MADPSHYKPTTLAVVTSLQDVHLAGSIVVEAVVVHANEVDQVGEEQRQTQVDEDLGRVVAPKFPGWAGTRSVGKGSGRKGEWPNR